MGAPLASCTIESGELRAGGKIIIKDIQREVFHEEFRLLGDNKGLPKGNQLVSLSPFIDPDGMLRVGGRLKNAPIPDCSKHQIIIPKDHSVTTLIIRHEHKSNGHIGVEHVLSNLRETYWVLGARVAIKRVICNCFFFV